MMTTTIYRDFLQTHLPGGAYRMADIYHAVRKIPYGSVGARDPEKVIANNVGSCSGKHILLRELLREAGMEAQAITMFTYFNRAIPVHPSMSETLRALIEGREVCDFHHYVRVRGDDGWLKLDATWHDALIPYGFPVNRDWQGGGDTVLAAEPIREYEPAEDLAARKVALIDELSEEERALRTKFFRELASWMAALPL